MATKAEEKISAALESLGWPLHSYRDKTEELTGSLNEIRESLDDIKAQLKRQNDLKWIEICVHACNVNSIQMEEKIELRSAILKEVFDV